MDGLPPRRAPWIAVVLCCACGGSEPEPEPAPQTAWESPPPAAVGEAPAATPEPEAPGPVPPPETEEEALPEHPTIEVEEVGTDGEGNPSHDVRLAGFPAIAADGATILIGDFIEYGDAFVAVWAVRGDRQRRRIVLPGTGRDLAARAEEVRALIAEGGYRPMTPVRVEEPGALDCSLPCATYEGGRLRVHAANDTTAESTPARRRLLTDQDARGRCVAGGVPTPPFGASVWMGADHAIAFAAFRYEAFIHGCELQNAYTALPLR